MVLAEFIQFKHGLYKSCGIECVEGIMLEPYLLQPCFHVAGHGRCGWLLPAVRVVAVLAVVGAGLLLGQHMHVVCLRGRGRGRGCLRDVSPHIPPVP